MRPSNRKNRGVSTIVETLRRCSQCKLAMVDDGFQRRSESFSNVLLKAKRESAKEQSMRNTNNDQKDQTE